MSNDALTDVRTAIRLLRDGMWNPNFMVRYLALEETYEIVKK